MLRLCYIPSIPTSTWSKGKERKVHKRCWHLHFKRIMNNHALRRPKRWRGPHEGWISSHFLRLFLLSHPCLPLLLHPCFPHSLPYSAFLLPLNLLRRSGEPCKLPVLRSEIMTAFAKVGRDQIHLVHMIYKVGGDASHGSHRLVAPMLINTTTTGNIVAVRNTQVIQLIWRDQHL